MRIRSTTIVAVRRDGKLAMAGDGQVTFDKTVMKHGARKVRRIAGGKVLVGFAGSAADGITLLEKFEAKLGEYKDNIVRAAVELAKDWRQDRVLRRLEALLIVGNPEHLFVISGNGDVIEPAEGIAAIAVCFSGLTLMSIWFKTPKGMVQTQKSARAWATAPSPVFL